MPDPTVNKPKSKIPSFDEVMAKPPIPSFKDVMGEKKNGGGNGLKQSAPITLPSQGGKPFGVFQDTAAQSQQIFPTKENPLPLVDKTAPQPVPTNTFTPDISNNFGLPKATDIAKQNSALKDNTQAAAIPVLKRKNVLGEDSGELAEGQDEGVKLAKEYAENKKLLDTRTNILNSQILNTYQDAAVAKGDMAAPKLFTPIPIKDKQPVIESLDAEKNDVVVRANALKKETIKKAGAYAAKMDANATTAGLTTRAILGDKAAIQQSEFLDKGLPVAPSDMFHNDQQGLEALSEGVDEQYKDDLNNPEYLSKKQDIQNQSRTLIDKYPEFKRQQISKIVAQEIMKDHPNADGMMILPYGMEAAKKLGLSEEDIKNIDFDNLPIQSPISNAVGAVYNGIISLGAGAARILGSAAGMDKDVLTANLNEATRNATERFEDVSTTQQLPTIVDANKNSPTYLQNIENPEAGKYNYNFHTISNAIGHGIGGLAQFIGGTKAVGNIVKGALPFVDATEAGMAGLMIGQGYEPYYQKANEVISDKPQDEWKRHAYALINGSLDYYAFKGLGKVVKSVSLDLEKEAATIFKDAPSLEKINRNALTKWTEKVVKGVEQTAGETAFVGGAQASSEIAKNIVDNTIGTGDAGKKSDRELGSVLLTGAESLPFAIMIPVGLSKVIAGARGSYVYKENIYNAGLNPETYLGQANKLLHDGVISQDQFNQRAQVINTATKVVNSIPADIELNHNQRVAYTNSKVRELALKAQAEKVDDAALEKFYADQIKREVDARTEILNGGSKEPSYVQPEADTKLSEPIVGVDEQGIPIGENVPAPENKTSQTETKVSQSTEKASTTNEAVDNVSKEAEGGANEAALISEAKDIVNTDVVKGFSAETLKDAANNKPEDFKSYLSEIAQQAHDEKSVKATVDTYGQPLVDIATKLFPKETQAEQQPIVNSNSENVPSDLATSYNSIADITEQVVADRNSTVEKANKLDDETNKPIRDKIDDIDAQMEKMRKENGVSTDVDLMRKLANDNIVDFGKLVGLRNERDNLYKQISNKNRSEYEKETDRIISEKIKPYQEAIDKEQKRIEDSIGNLSKELGAKSGDFMWGDKPIDEEMGDRIGDNKSAIFIKPHETDIDTFNGEDSIVDGLQIELVTVNEKNRGEGLAKKRLQEITEAADKHQLTLFLDAAPQEKTITEEGLKKLYSQFGFEFDGIHGKREPENKPTISKEQSNENKNITLQNERNESAEKLGTNPTKSNTEKVQYNGTDAIGERSRPESDKIASRKAAKEKISNPDTNASLQAAKKYNESAGLPLIEPHKFKPSDKEAQSKISEVYKQLRDVTAPDYTETELERQIFDSYKKKYQDILSKNGIKNYKELVEKSYAELAKEVDAQFKALPVKVDFHDGDHNYESSAEMLDDVHNYGHLWVFNGGDDHTLMGSKTKDKNGLTANDKFRAVHDYFGHSIEGFQFGKDGEENAWIEHSKMFSPLAQIALSSETRGQNSFVNYSGVNDVPLEKIKLASALRKKGLAEKNPEMIKEGDKLLEEANNEFKFAEQKSIALPEQDTNARQYFGTSERAATEVSPTIPTEIKEPKGQENKAAIQRSVEPTGQGNAEAAPTVLKEGKYKAKAKKIADDIRKAELPSWLVNTDPTIKKSGVSADSLKNAFADAVELAGELLDKGVEVKDAIKQAADKIIDHILTDYPKGAKLKSERESQIREGFESYYKDNIIKSEEINNIPLQKIKEDANNIITGAKVFKRFSPEEQRGIAAGGEIHAEASVILSRNEGANEQAKSTNEKQENQIEQYAKDKGVWVDNVNEKYGKPDNSGEESIVWANPKNDGTVIKSQNTFQYGDLQEKLDGITLHNSLFPETAIKVLGFGKNVDGDFQVIVEQPFVKGEKPTTQELRDFMKNMGFDHVEDNNYSNKQTLIDDLHTGNAIKTSDGKIAVIDPIMRLNTPEQGYGGDRVIDNSISDAGKGNKPPIEKVKVAEGEDNSIGIRHVDTAEMREERKLPEYEKKATTIPEINAEADKRIKEGKMPELIERLEEGGGLTGGVEQAMLGKYIAKLNDLVEANPTKENIAEFDKAMRLNEIAGTTSFGQVGRVRQERYLPENSFGESLRDEAMSLGIKTEDLPKDVLDKIEQEHKEMDQLRKDLSKAEAENERLRKDKKAKVEVQKIIKESRKAGKRDFKAERQSLKDKLRSQFDDYKAAGNKLGIAADGGVESFVITAKMAKTITDIVKSYADEGIAKFDELVNKTFDDVKDVLGNIKKKDIVDVLAGDYNEKLPTRSELAQRMRDIRTEASLLKKLNDARLGKEPASREGKAKKSQRITDLENRIKEIRKNNNDDTPVEQTEGQRLAAKEKAMLKKIASIEADVKAGKFQKEEPLPPVILNKKELAIQDRLIELEAQQAMRRAKQDYDNLNKWDRSMDTFWQIAGLRRLVNAAIDFSILFRQASPITLNPFKYIRIENGRIVKGTAPRAIINMFNLAFNPKGFKRFQYNIERTEVGRLFTHFDGTFSNPSEVRMEKREEEFTNSLFSRIGQKIEVGGSNKLKKAAEIADRAWFSERAAAALLNTIRVEEFSRDVRNLRRNGITPENSPKDYKDAVKWSMNKTGRGNMVKVLEDSHAGRLIANRTYFGARLMAAKVNMLNPLTYARMNPQMRTMAIKDMAGATSGFVMLALAGAAAGGTVSLNPDEPDFLQLRFGDKVFDLTGGSVAYVRTFLRFIKAVGGQVKSPNSKASNSYTSFAGKSIAKSLVVNKLSPNNSYLYHFWTRKSGQYDESGHLKPFDPYEIVRIYPMYVDGTKSAYEKGGISDALTIMIPDIFGIGTQQYVKKSKRPVGGGGGASSSNY